MAAVREGQLITLAAAADAITEQVDIMKIKWIGDDIADGDILILDDAAGNVIYHHIATADDTGVEDDFDYPYSVTGITVDTMTSNHGTCYVFIR